MPDTTNTIQKPPSWLQRLRQWLVPAVILLMAGGIVSLIAGNWNTWTSERVAQETDDAYLRADLTPLSTKVAGLVAQVAVSDYQPVKSGDLLVQLRDDDFQAQVQQAQAAVVAGEDSLINNRRQKELQDARVVQAGEGIGAAEAEIAAAEAGIEAAHSAIANARSGIDAAKADVERTGLERRRQESLIATESATRQKLEQVVADEQRYRAQLSSREADLGAAAAQLASRQADLARARARLGSTKAELEAQKRQRAVLDSQELLLHADLDSKRASLALARTNLGYTRILAPEAGIVSERKVRPGQLVSPGTQVISLVQSEIWVEANYKETQVRHIRSGDPAEVRIDAFPGSIFRGKVDHVSPASGSQFALLPPDNATGNFTKIVQRVPVKILLDASQESAASQASAQRLRPGLSVIATIRTSVGQ
ncbi:MAG TPA: HlyD family secretion protein [Candidatus Acidoferrales bacterium]|jgi:membrane fusion protein (multidrug efflux system)|nr:HlyD family secretion protein [Candidatus Acidoferrales bacterium]